MARYYRRIIKITGDDSPNVRFARAQIAAGLEPTNEMILPGVLSWQEYCKRRETWDIIRQTVGLDAEFYEGAQVRLYPPEWLARAAVLAVQLQGKQRKARAIGIDPAEGGDSTTMSAVDELGLIEQLSQKTPDTGVIRGLALAFMRRHNVEPSMVLFDAGGGGTQIADEMRRDGYNVRTLPFGGAPQLAIKRGTRLLDEKIENREDRFTYTMLRDQFYGELRVMMDPCSDGPGFAIPAEYAELRRQLSLIPLTYDKEGRLKLLPKNKPRKPGESVIEGATGQDTLVGLIGHSPDEADSLVLAVFAMNHKVQKQRAGAAQ